MAIPMKRQMINIEQLRFPSGIAAAETLRALHAKSSRGLRAAKALGLAGLIAAIDKVWAEGLSSISPGLERFSSEALLTDLQKWLLGSHYAAWAGRTVIFSWDFIFLAAGAITGSLREHIRLGHVVLGRGNNSMKPIISAAITAPR
jgi:uncharacterized oligopeptide transporter (OPT) family protein